MQLARWGSLNNTENSSDFAFLDKVGGPNREVDAQLQQLLLGRGQAAAAAGTLGDTSTSQLGGPDMSTKAKSELFSTFPTLHYLPS